MTSSGSLTLRLAIPTFLGAAGLVFLLAFFGSPSTVSDRIPNDGKRDYPVFSGVLVLLVDCMRVDHVSCYGYERNTTPNIDSVAADGIRFERCYAQSNWTKPSVASLFTGLYVRRHGVTIGSKVLDKGGGTKDAPLGAYPLPDDIPVVSESFKKAGFRTVGFVENSHIVPAQGFGRGFDFYERLKPATHHFQKWLDKSAPMDPGDPCFAYIHLIGPHDPYDSNKRQFDPYRFRFGDFDSEINFKELDYKKLDTLDARDVNQGIAFYDAELAYHDQDLIGPLLDRLRRDGLYDDLLIVILADHGEELYDHGGWAHGHALYEEVIRVPLIVKLPESFAGLTSGSIIQEPVELIDLFPTVCELAGINPPKDLDGKSLASLLMGDRPTDSEALVVSEHANHVTSQVMGAAILKGNRKYIEHYPLEGAPNLSRETHGDVAIFDLQADHGERTNLAGTEPRVQTTLQLELQRRLGATPDIRRPAPKIVPLTKEERAHLEALGYIEED